MGHLAPEDRFAFELKVQRNRQKGKLAGLAAKLEDRIKVKEEQRLSDKRLHYLQYGIWITYTPGPSEVVLSSDEDSGEEIVVATTSLGAVARSLGTLVISSSEEEDSDNDDDGDEDEGSARQPSPELWGDDGIRDSNTPSTSPAVSPKRRTTTRASKQTQFLGNRIPSCTIDLDPAAPRRARKRMKAIDKAQKIQAISVEPKKEIKEADKILQNDRDERVLANVEAAFERWEREEDKDGEATKHQVRTYEKAIVGDEEISAGDFVAMAGKAEPPRGKAKAPSKKLCVWFGRVIYFHKEEDSAELQVHVHWCSTSRSSNGQGAHPRHLLFRETCDSSPASAIVQKVKVEFGTDTTVAQDSFFLRSVTLPNKSTASAAHFLSDPPDTGYCELFKVRPCWGCEDRLEHDALHGRDRKGEAVPYPRWRGSGDSSVLLYDGIEYHIGDAVYLKPDLAAPAHWNGGQAAFRLAILGSVEGWPAEERPPVKPTTKLILRPLLRQGHVLTSNKRDERSVILTHETSTLRLDNLAGKFRLESGSPPSILELHQEQEVFWCDSHIPESDNLSDERAILRVWSRPPCLLRPHEEDKEQDSEIAGMVVEGADFETCAVCSAEQEEEEEEMRAFEEEAAGDPNLRLSTLSLFAGAGLLDKGLEMGCPELDVKIAIEKDADAAMAFKLNHPGAKVQTRNVSYALEKAWTAEGDDEEREILEQDAIVGGPPCQSFSRANRQKTRDDPRSLQPMVFASFFELGGPLFGLMENVVAMATHKFEEPGDVLGTLTDLFVRFGYDVQLSVANAAAFGCAQHRRRLLLHVTKTGAPTTAVPEPSHSVSNRWGRLRTVHRDEGTTEGTRDNEDGKESADEAEAAAHVEYSAATMRGHLHSAPHPPVTVGEVFQLFEGVGEYLKQGLKGVFVPPGTDLRSRSNNVVMGFDRKTEERIAMVGHHDEEGKTGNWRDFAHDPDLCIQVPKSVKLQEDAFRRLWEDEISPPLLTEIKPNGSNGARIHPTEDRIISISEALRLQGAPLDYECFPGVKAGQKSSKVDVQKAYKLIGNGVAIPMAAAYGRQLRKNLANLVATHSQLASDGSPFVSSLSRQLSAQQAIARAQSDGNLPKKKVEVVVIDDPNDVADDESTLGDDVDVDGDGDLVLTDVDEEDDQHPLPAALSGSFRTLDTLRDAALDVYDDSSNEEVIVVSEMRKRSRPKEFVLEDSSDEDNW
ncbi:hypothetical protein JCM11641_000818 [Rhodosporidiobolus odoratus]